jgi:hypothetical protein
MNLGLNARRLIKITDECRRVRYLG